MQDFITFQRVIFRFESSLLLLTGFCNFSHLTFSAISTLSGGMTSICSKSSSRRFSMFVSICRVLRIQSININTLSRNNSTHILLFLSPKKMFKFLEHSTIKLVLLRVVIVLAITHHCSRGIDEIYRHIKEQWTLSRLVFTWQIALFGSLTIKTLPKPRPETAREESLAP